MNNNNNSEVNGTVIAFALIGVAMMYLAIFVVALLAIYSIFMSFVCFRAWNKPYKFIKWMIYPVEARVYVYTGIAGAIIVPIIAAIISSIGKFTIEDQYVWLIILAGYGIGSNISGLVMSHFEADIIADYHAKNPAPSIPATPKAESDENEEQASFEFASWDDEEKR